MQYSSVYVENATGLALMGFPYVYIWVFYTTFVGVVFSKIIEFKMWNSHRVSTLRGVEFCMRVQKDYI